MTRRQTATLLVFAVLAMLAVGCGGSSNAEPTGTEPSTTTSVTETTTGETTDLLVFFLRGGEVGPVLRTVPETEGVARAAIEQLLAGPTAQDHRADLVSGIPIGTLLNELEIADGVARVTLSSNLSPGGTAQLVYTVTQFPTVKRVALTTPSGERKGLTRAAFEDFTPAILLESPTPFAEISSPVRITGTANTFEATFQVDVRKLDGTVLATQHVTATSGTGTRGTFSAQLPFDAPAGPVDLVVYEYSAENGEPINMVKIRVRATGSGGATTTTMTTEG